MTRPATPRSPRTVAATSPATSTTWTTGAPSRSPLIFDEAQELYQADLEAIRKICEAWRARGVRTHLLLLGDLNQRVEPTGFTWKVFSEARRHRFEHNYRNSPEILDLAGQQKFDDLGVWKSGEKRAPHKPLLILYALGRWVHCDRAPIPLLRCQPRPDRARGRRGGRAPPFGPLTSNERRAQRYMAWAESDPASDLSDLDAAESDVTSDLSDLDAAGEGAARKCLEHFRAAGEALLKAKRQVGHGHWMAWMKANLVCSHDQAAGETVYRAQSECGPGQVQRRVRGAIP
jgi:hypothetical protein